MIHKRFSNERCAKEEWHLKNQPSLHITRSLQPPGRFVPVQMCRLLHQHFDFCKQSPSIPTEKTWSLISLFQASWIWLVVCLPVWRSHPMGNQTRQPFSFSPLTSWYQTPLKILEMCCILAAWLWRVYFYISHYRKVLSYFSLWDRRQIHVKILIGTHNHFLLSAQLQVHSATNGPLRTVLKHI